MNVLIRLFFYTVIFAWLFRSYEFYEAYAMKMTDEKATVFCHQAKTGMLFSDFFNKVEAHRNYLHAEYIEKKAHYFLFTYGVFQKIAACHVFVEEGKITTTKLELSADLPVNNISNKQ